MESTRVDDLSAFPKTFLRANDIRASSSSSCKTLTNIVETQWWRRVFAWRFEILAAGWMS
jgi:hypothetical protein